jgi:pimeloyl-ACP methyl ester carboxylesterase
MKEIILVGIFVVLSFLIFAEQITGGEYYFDVDPGSGNGIPLTGTFGNSIVDNASGSIDTSSLSIGCHWVFVRFKNSLNEWGESNAAMITIMNPTDGTIVAAEYYWDNDPGEGNGCAIIGDFSTEVSVITGTEINTSGLQVGCHWLFIRFKNNAGYWGKAQASLVTIQSSFQSDILAAEYYWDTDPGIGLGIPIVGATLANGEYLINQSFEIPYLSPGCHILNIRFRDSNNRWSKANSALVAISNPNNPNITAAEYYFDADPGVGLGNSLSGEWGNPTVLASALNVSTTGLSNGYHSIFVRFCDSNGIWGLSLPYEITIGNQLLWLEDFTSYDPDRYYVNGIAAPATTNQNFILTTPQTYKNGRIYYKTQQYIYQFQAEFDFLIGGGTGADGITFSWCPDYTYSTSNGGSLDFNQTNGYGVEFDTYTNTNDISEEHIGLIYNQASNHLAQVVMPNNSIENNTWHHAKIEFNQGRVRVYMDGTLYLDHLITGYIPFHGYFGFSGSTGSQTNYHIIDNIIVRNNDVVDNVTISGYCLDYANAPISGVTIHDTSFQAFSQVTDSNGYFCLTLPSGFSGGIVAEITGWVFSPTSKTFSNVTSNKVNNNFMGRLAQPVFTPPGDTYSASQNVTLQSQATGNVKYRYSFSSTPSYNSGSVYYDGFPIVVQNNTSINAVAYIEGRPGSVSDIATSTYAIEQEQDSRIRFRIDYSALPNGDVSFVDLVAKGLPSRFARSQVTSNQVGFTLFNLTASLFSFIGTSETSNLILRNSQLEEIGHIPFNYTQLDWLTGKRIDGVLVVNGQHTPAGEGWNYYNNDERMVSMLIKPTNLNASRKPMILVHGINGTYPYFDKDFINKLDGNPNTTTDDIFDIWQFYYPNDQQIEISGKLLGDAIQRVQSYGYNARVNIVAHSMGGLVTRSLIQSSDYQQNIRKFLMLGTPNHGSHSTFRLSHHRDYPASTLVNSIFVGTDSESPAVKQLYPGSAFLTALNSQVPNELYPGAPQANTYLVVAGTTNEADWLSSSREILSPSSMDDMVVSLPSASLLDGGIPLATVPVNHLGLCGNTPKDIPFLFRKMNPAYLYSFFSDSYQANGNPFGGSVTNYWSSTPIASQQASNTSVQFGAVLDSDCIDVERTGMTLKLKFTDYESSINAINRRIKNRLIRSEFSDDSNKSYYFMEQIKTTLGIATGSGLTGDFPPGNYTLRLQNRNSKTFKSVQNPLPVNNAISSSIYISLTPGEKAIANFTNSTVYSQSNKLRDGLNRTLTEEQYYIDASIDSLVFYIGGAEGTIGFANHNAHLIDPENTIIDQNYASVSPEVDFSEDIEAGFAYYYVRNPMPGLWKLRYSDSLPNTLSATLINSPISLSALVEDTMFAIGDTISVQIPLPKPVTYVNPHISISLNYLDMNLITHALGNLEASYNSADSLYQCSFVPEFPGDYKLSINFQCSLDGSDVRRSIEKVIPVLAHKIPHVIAPLAGEGNLPTNLTLQWNSSILAQSYQLKLFSVSDSLAIVSTMVTDTFYVVSNLEYGKEYFWYVSAVNGYGTSQTSNPSNFFTKLPQPILQAPENSAIDLPQTVDLSWEPVPGALYYHLQFSDDPLFGYCYINDSLVVTAGFELNGLSNLQTYYWRVAAVDERGTSDWSDPRSFTVRNYMISFPQTVQMRENEALTLYLANNIDNYSPGQYEITVSGATNLTAIVSYDRIVITPLENWFGTEELLLTVNDISRFLFNNNSASRTIVYQQTLSVMVTELNSLPTLTMGENLLFWNSEDKILDLTPYLSDPDNPVNEIQITGIASAHIAVSCIGQSISFLPQPGWYGQELIEIQLSNTIPRSMITSHTKVSSERTENSCTSFYFLVNIVDATPKISECAFYNGEIHLGWKQIIGSDSYQIFSSTSVYGVFQDVTNTGTLFVQDGYVKFQQTLSAPQRFYYVKAVKSQSRINYWPLIFNR